MGIVKIFYKDDCPMCPAAKKLKDSLRDMNVSVDDYNVGTTDGLAEATYYRVMALPTILVEDDAENSIGDWRGNVPHIDEVLSAVQSA
jgi:hypothetical protein